MNDEGTLKIESYQVPISDIGENHIIDVVPSDRAIPVFPYKPLRTFTFENGKQKAIIDFNGDEVTFSGDLSVDEAAKIFFEAIFVYFQPGTCRTCCWYKREESNKICSCPKMVYGYGLGEADIDIDGIKVENDEEWGMVPGPDFGCIHHKEKS